ncbi:MAG TPA: hypothetical protein VFT22_30620 [Kofleriaceae bacterium]|nr:hypothetical protein [Kofleriaceae bacterium]
MKNPRISRKLTLNTETIAHLRQIAIEELGAIRGGLAGQTLGICIKTTLTDQC